MSDNGKKQIFNGNVAVVAGNDVTIHALYQNGQKPKTQQDMVGELMQFHKQSDAHRIALKCYAEGTHKSSFYNKLSEEALTDMLAFKNVLEELLAGQQAQADAHIKDAQTSADAQLNAAQVQADKQLNEAQQQAALKLAEERAETRFYRLLSERRCFLCRLFK